MATVAAGGIMIDASDFFAAIRAGHTERVQDQLAQEPALLQARHEGATALHVAAIGNDRAMAVLLLDAGADLNARDDTYQMTPIGWANEEGHEVMVRFLYDRGAEIDLHQAAAYGLLDHVRDLVKRTRREVNANMGGWTPLQLATLWGHPDVVELLLSRGGDPLVRDPFGRTTLEIARAQVSTEAGSTPLVHAERRLQIVTACATIADHLMHRNSPA
jgi:ankyrin repeat protein